MKGKVAGPGGKLLGLLLAWYCLKASTEIQTTRRERPRLSQNSTCMANNKVICGQGRSL